MYYVVRNPEDTEDVRIVPTHMLGHYRDKGFIVLDTVASVGWIEEIMGPDPGLEQYESMVNLAKRTAARSA
jgi:hypothetical protein